MKPARSIHVGQGMDRSAIRLLIGSAVVVADRGRVDELNAIELPEHRSFQGLPNFLLLGVLSAHKLS